MSNRHITIADMIEAVSDAVPDRIAVFTNEGQRTYRELDERSTRLANHLKSVGVRAGDHVAIHSGNCLEWPEAFYACFKIRAVPVNINYRYVENELRYLYENSDSVGVIVAPEYVEAVASVAADLPKLRHQLVIGEEYEKALAQASPERDFEERSEDDIFIIYTGGTTGLPKGVMWRHGDVLPGALNAYRFGAPIDSTEQLAQEASANENPMRLQIMAPMMHGGGQWAMASTHVVGGTVVLYTRPSVDPHEVLSLAERGKTVAISLIGDAMARPLADHLARLDHPDYDLSSLQAIANGGAPLSQSSRERLMAVLPNVMLIDSYGSSETGTTGIEHGADKFTVPRFRVGPETTVLGINRQPAAPGELGMLARSGYIPLGYYGDPEKTAESFCVVDGTRWVLSGDSATIETDGTITIIGRGSLSINTGGEKVYPEEVEAALKTHDDVLDCVVVGTPSEIWGEQVTALVQRKQDSELTSNDLRHFARTVMAGYKVPKTVIFVEEVPRTNVGKVDYKAGSKLASELMGQSLPD